MRGAAPAASPQASFVGCWAASPDTAAEFTMRTSLHHLLWCFVFGGLGLPWRHLALPASGLCITTSTCAPSGNHITSQIQPQPTTSPANHSSRQACASAPGSLPHLVRCLPGRLICGGKVHVRGLQCNAVRGACTGTAAAATAAVRALIGRVVCLWKPL